MRNIIHKLCIFLIFFELLFIVYADKYVKETFYHLTIFGLMFIIYKCSLDKLKKIKNTNKNNDKTKPFLVIIASLPLLIASILYYNGIDFIPNRYSHTKATETEMFYTSIFFFLAWLFAIWAMVYHHFKSKK